MKRNQRHRHLALLIFIPLLVAICLCTVLLLPRVSDFFTSAAYPDYLWALRMTKVLSDKGYPVHDVSVSDSEPAGFRILDVQIGNLVGDEEQRTYELVKEVHSAIMETFLYATAQPQPPTVIDVMVIDYDSGSYTVFTEYETVQKFYDGEISEQIYFEQWSYPENTPEITPP
jgi:hypothetical protein